MSVDTERLSRLTSFSMRPNMAADTARTQHIGS